jgi:hypothetical protein
LMWSTWTAGRSTGGRLRAHSTHDGCCARYAARAARHRGEA